MNSSCIANGLTHSLTNDLIYLDNNATTAVDPVVFEAMLPWLRDQYGNPSSVYQLGRKAFQAIERARQQIAQLLGAKASEILFTSGGSESIQTAIRSAVGRFPEKRHVITSAAEHHATLALCDQLARQGIEVTRLKVNALGHLDLDELRQVLREDTAIVSLLAANNETGVLFPTQEIAALCRERGVLFHSDAVQAVGKLPIHVGELGVHFLSLSGHKLHCLKGIGVLYVNSQVPFVASLPGSQEKGRRGGTQNVAGIVGMGCAAEVAALHLKEDEVRIRGLRDRFEQEILSRVSGVVVNGDPVQRLFNTSSLTFEGIVAEEALILLDQNQICCSAGSACSSGHPSHVLQVMGFSREHIQGSLRFSFGRFNTLEEVDRAVEEIPKVIQKLRASQGGKIGRGVAE